MRRATSAAARRARDLGAARVALYLPAAGVSARERAQATVEGALLGTYRFDKYLKEKSGKALASLPCVEPDRRQQAAARDGVRLGQIGAAATTLARDLVNEPANVVTPSYLADPGAGDRQGGAPAGARARRGRRAPSWAWEPIIGVAQGSQEPPRFIHLTYAPGRRARRRVAIIGKGITFDSGGLDLKTADGMLRMKGDMSGAAAVLGVFQALPRLRLPVEVHGLIAATENMPSGTAQRPGDIVRAMNGAHHRDRQHRRRGAPDARGRARLRRQARSSPTRWSTWPP